MPCRLNRLFGLLWYDFRVFWLSITCLKSAAKCLFSFYHNKCRSDISKKSNFWPCRPKGCKIVGPQSLPPPGFEPGPLGEQQLLNKVANGVASNPKCLNFFWPPTLSVHSFVAAWARCLKDKSSFENPFNISLEPEAQGPSMSFKGLNPGSK